MRAARPSPTRRRWGRSGTPSRRCRGSRCPDVEASEDDDAALSFAVTLDPAATGRLTVDYATADGTATAGSDYTTTSGTLTFAAGERSKTVSVPITDDSLEDEGETLTLRLSKAPLPAASVRTSGGASVVMPRTALMNSRPHRTKDCCAGALVGRPDK